MADGELQFVEWLRAQQRDRGFVRVGIGDDMAVVDSAAAGDTASTESADQRGRPGSSNSWLISSDMLLDQVHFDTAKHGLTQIGRKAVACSLSDCAAMAVCPLAATVSVAIPSSLAWDDAKELFRGMFAIADEFEVAVVGGDTTRWPGRLAIDVAIAARPFESVEPVTRAGARPGDVLYVTGPLGGSLLGKHLTFTPRVQEARRLATDLGDRLHAMIDISDGLALDLWRLCTASDVGTVLDSAELEAVISDDARRAAAEDGHPPIDHVLGDGEDFELLLAVERPVTDSPVALYRIGEVTERGLEIRTADGRVERLEPKGYVHS